MSSPPVTNGLHPSQPHWSQLPVQRFLATFNWANQAVELSAPEMVDLGPTTARSLDLTWPVNQFFGAINWPGTTSTPSPAVKLAEATMAAVADHEGILTLGDFADLF
jgi:hypothetical protein